MDIKERIIARATELFMTYGIKSVTMDALANNLGMSKRTIYEIFTDKDELLMAVLTRIAEQQKEMVKKVLDQSGNAIEAIFKMIEINRDYFQGMSPAFLADLKKYVDVLLGKTDKIEMPDHRNNKIVIEKGIKEGLFREDINPDLANRCLNNLGRSVMDNEVYPYGLFSRREVLRNTIIHYLRGISTPKGLELINRLEANFFMQF